MQVNPGTWYVVTTDSECTVTDANGKTLCTAVAGGQKPFLATTMEVTLSDPGATVTKSTFNAALALLGQPSGGGSVIAPPAGAIAVDYLESSGNQYIKTGYFGNQDTGLLSIHQQVTAGNVRVAGTRDPANVGKSVLMAHSRNSEVGTAYGYAKMLNSGSVTTGWKERQTGTTNYKNGRRNATRCIGETFTMDSLNEAWGTKFTCPFELYIFAFNNGGSPTSGYLPFKGKIFSFRITQRDTIVRDYKPYVSRDGKPFMFDAVTGRVLENAGTGAFRIGLSTVEQVRAVFNNLPDLNGAATPGELFIRLDESIATDEVRALMNTICNSKNWGYVEA